MEQPRFESEGRRAKRERNEEEEEPLEEENCFKAVKQRCFLSDLLGKDDDDAVFTTEDEFYDQELIFGVMKSLAAEITGSSPPTIPSSEPSLCVYDLVSAENACNAATNVDLEYLLGATDDELGIPPSPNCVAEDQIMNDIDAQNPAEGLFENPQVESQSEGLLQLYDSDCWYLSYEYELAMLNDSLCQDCRTRSLQDDAIYGSLYKDKAQMHLLESRVGM